MWSLKHTPLMHMTQKEALKLHLRNPEVNPKLSFDLTGFKTLECHSLLQVFFSTTLGLLQGHNEKNCGLHVTSLHWWHFHVIYTSSGKLQCALTMQKSSAITLSMLNNHLNGSHRYFSGNTVISNQCWACPCRPSKFIQSLSVWQLKMRERKLKSLSHTWQSNWTGSFFMDKYLHIQSQRHA